MVLSSQVYQELECPLPSLLQNTPLLSTLKRPLERGWQQGFSLEDKMPPSHNGVPGPIPSY